MNEQRTIQIIECPFCNKKHSYSHDRGHDIVIEWCAEFKEHLKKVIDSILGKAD